MKLSKFLSMIESQCTELGIDEIDTSVVLIDNKDITTVNGVGNVNTQLGLVEIAKHEMLSTHKKQDGVRIENV